MAYTPTIWQTGDTITEEKLNKIEQGILANSDYDNIDDKPSVNGVELEGDKSTSDLHIDHVPLADNLVATTGTTDTTPYLSRSSQGPIAELRKIIGGTLAWNQIIPARTTTSTAGDVTFAGNGDGSVTVTGTTTSSTTSSAFVNVGLSSNVWKLIPNHVFYVGLVGNASPWMYLRACYTQNGSTKTDTTIVNQTSGTVFRFTGSSDMTQSWFRIGCPNVGTYDCTVWPMAIDLTQMLGATIADYVLSLETATPGSAREWFRQYFPSSYYPYSASTLQSVQTSARQALDRNGNVIRSYPLDSDLTLRGIPKLTNGVLSYDGDIYLPNGEVTRKYGVATFNGSETLWGSETVSGVYSLYINLAAVGKMQDRASGTLANGQCRANNFLNVTTTQPWQFTVTSNYINFRVDSTITTVSEWKTWLASHPQTVLYPLATPTTESADPYTEVQLAGTTEQFVTENYIPVGNESFYPTDLTGVVQNLAPLPTTQGTYKLQVTVTNGIPTYSWVTG